MEVIDLKKLKKGTLAVPPRKKPASISLTARLDIGDYEKLNDLAKDTHISKSVLVRSLIKNWLDTVD